jgi:hypothetical protein
MSTLFLIRKTFVNGLELHIMNIGLIQQEVEGGVPICSANLSSPVVDTAAYIKEIHYKIGNQLYIENAD